MTTQRVYQRELISLYKSKACISFLSICSLDPLQYFAMQINSGFMRQTLAVPYLIYENTCVKLMCRAGVYDATAHPYQRLDKCSEVQGGHALLLPKTKGFSASRHIQESRSAYTPSIFPTNSIMESVSILQESYKQSCGVFSGSGLKPSEVCCSGFGKVRRLYKQ